MDWLQIGTKALDTSLALAITLAAVYILVKFITKLIEKNDQNYKDRITDKDEMLKAQREFENEVRAAQSAHEEKTIERFTALQTTTLLAIQTFNEGMRNNA